MTKTAFGLDSLCRSMTVEWFNRFRDGRQSTEFSPRPKNKARQVKSNVKTILIVLFHIEVIVHHEFVSHEQIVNRIFDKDVSMRLREVDSRKTPGKMAKKNHVSSPRKCASTYRRAFLADKKYP